MKYPREESHVASLCENAGEQKDDISGSVETTMSFVSNSRFIGSFESSDQLGAPNILLPVDLRDEKQVRGVTDTA